MMMRQVWRPALEWLVWVVLVTVAYLQIPTFDQEISVYAYGPSGWPRAVCVALLIGATCQLGWQIMTLWRDTTSADSNREITAVTGSKNARTAAAFSSYRSIIQRGCFFLAPFLYLFVATRVGFYVSAPFFILLLLLLLEVRSIWALLSVTLTIYGIALLVFTRLFFVALPVGRANPFYDINNAIIAIVRTGI